MREKEYLKRSPRTMLFAVLVFLMSVCTSWAQSSVFRVGVLTPGLAFDPVFLGLREGLGRLGYGEGKNIVFMVENTKGGGSDLVNRARNVLETKADVLFTVSTSHTAAAKQATTTVPIVFAAVGDPLRSGFIASYASSKNNLTGVSFYVGPLSGKRLEILKEIAPEAKRVLAVTATKDSIAEISFQVLKETASKLGVQLVRRDVTSREEIERVILETPTGSVDAVYHVPSALVGAYIDLLIKKAKEDKIPMVVPESTMVEKGGLLSYGPDFRQAGAQAARIVAKVLKGGKPSDIPIETPEKLLLVINMTTAKAIGLKIPRRMLDKVDRLVE